MRRARSMHIGRTQSGRVLLPNPPSWCTPDEADQWLHDVLDLLHDRVPPHPRTPTYADNAHSVNTLDQCARSRPAGAATREGVGSPGIATGVEDPHLPAGPVLVGGESGGQPPGSSLPADRSPPDAA